MSSRASAVPRVVRPVVDVWRRPRPRPTSVGCTLRRRRIDVVVVDGVALDADLDRVHAFLDARVLGLVALVEEHRDRDRGEDADDDDHDQQLDEGEALLTPCGTSSLPISSRLWHLPGLTVPDLYSAAEPLPPAPRRPTEKPAVLARPGATGCEV